MPGHESVQIISNWPLPSNVRAAFTTRLGGTSAAPYDTFNLGTHVGDNHEQVLENRQLLSDRLSLPRDPFWLNQIHGVNVVTVDATQTPDADGSYTDTHGAVCAVLSADCLPILVASDDGQEIAAVHGGWRGLLDGVIPAAVGRFKAPTERLSVWLGPRISATNYEVGYALVENFKSADMRYAAACLQRGEQHFLDLSLIARLQLNRLGIEEIHDCELCTFASSREFYSYRRDGVTGRFASLIWRTD